MHPQVIIPIKRCEDVDSNPITTLVLNCVHVHAEQICVTIYGTTSEYEKDKLKGCLTKLSGGVAVLKTSAASEVTEVEVNKKKDQVNYPLCTTHAAVKEGIVPGGGLALLHACKALDALETELTTESEDHHVRVRILRSVPLPDR